MRTRERQSLSVAVSSDGITMCPPSMALALARLAELAACDGDAAAGDAPWDDAAPLVAGVRLPLHRHVLELCGAPHTGKTQLCLAAVARAALRPGQGVALVLSGAAEGLGARLSQVATQELQARWARAAADAPVPPLRRLFPHAALSLAGDVQASADEARAAGDDGPARALAGGGLAAAVERHLRSLVGLVAAGDEAAAAAAAAAADDVLQWPGVPPAAVPDGAAKAELLGFEVACALRQVALYSAHDGWSVLRLLQGLAAWLLGGGGSGGGADGAPPPLPPPPPPSHPASLEAGSGGASGGDGEPPVWGDADAYGDVGGLGGGGGGGGVGMEGLDEGGGGGAAAAAAGAAAGGGGASGDPPVPAADRLSRPPVAPYALPPAYVVAAPSAAGEGGVAAAAAAAAATDAAPFVPPAVAPLRLLVVDSLGTLLAASIGGGGGGGDGGGGGGGGGPRQHVGHALMAETGRLLARLSRQHGVSAIVTNSVTAERSFGALAGGAPAAISAAGAFKPALGPSWRYVPDTTVMLEPTQPPTHAPRQGVPPQPLQPVGTVWPPVTMRRPGA